MPVIRKKIHFVRHAEGKHNEGAKKHNDFFKGMHLSKEYTDAKLSDYGHQQCKILKSKISTAIPKPDLVVSSSLSRAIQTARYCYDTDVEICATDECAERRSDNESDRRSDVTVLKTIFENQNINFDDIEDDVYTLFEIDKEKGKNGELLSKKCMDRVQKFIVKILTHPGENIVVFTHSVFLYHLLSMDIVKSINGSQNKNIRFKTAELYTIEIEMELKTNEEEYRRIWKLEV